MTFPKALIPFYYLFKKEKKVNAVEEDEKKHPIRIITNVNDFKKDVKEKDTTEV